jgi:hypothetical protein
MTQTKMKSVNNHIMKIIMNKNCQQKIKIQDLIQIKHQKKLEKKKSKEVR